MEFRDIARGGPATGGPGDSDQELWKQALTFLARGLAHKTYRAQAEDGFLTELIFAPKGPGSASLLI